MLKAKILKRRVEGKTVALVLKTLSTAEARFKVVEDKGDKWIVEGYASVFGNVDSYGEIVKRGAFADWIRENMPRYPKMVWAHDWSLPLGPTLEAVEDDYGLFVRGELLKDVQKAVEAHALIVSGAVTDLSFGFSVIQDELDPKTGIRTLIKLAIYEWSPVLVGANSQAMITGAKSAESELKADGDYMLEPEDGKETISADPPKPVPPPPAPAPEGEDPTKPVPADPEKPAETNVEDDAPAPKTMGDRVLSAKHRSLLQGAADNMRTAATNIEALLQDAAAADDGKGATLPDKPSEESPREGILVIRAMKRHAKKADQHLGKVLILAKRIKG